MVYIIHKWDDGKLPELSKDQIKIVQSYSEGKDETIPALSPLYDIYSYDYEHEVMRLGCTAADTYEKVASAFFHKLYIIT